MIKKKNIFVTQPFLPPLEEFIPYLEKIWDSKWITNNGQFHKKLEQALVDFLGVDHLSLFSNGTLALMVALKAANITGEVITTPFSFVATSHAILWNQATPVFRDIDPQTLNIDPHKIEALITPNTQAIMPVHVYGNPCNNDAIQEIADKHNLKVIYDAAHAFNVKKNGTSVLNWGDMSVLSFHATKVFNTFEGGAIVCHSPEMKQHIDYLKNFGFAGETAVVSLGINGKMNEVQAAFGLLQLQYNQQTIEKRKAIAALYRAELQKITGIYCLEIPENVEWNGAYFPILVQEKQYPLSRDKLYQNLKENNVFCRRYFYPLISNFATYSSMPSAQKKALPVANRIANQVLCLPIYSDLTVESVAQIVDIIKQYA